MPDSKKILLIGGNYFPEQIGIGKYNSEMTDWFSSQGYDCAVITSYPYYPDWQIQESYIKNAHWYKTEIAPGKDVNSKSIKIYRCPQYTPSSPSGMKRMLLDFTFFMSALMVVIKLLFVKKYDYVITVVPSFMVGLLAILYKRFRNARFVYHIQDLQIDAAKEMGMIKSRRLINFLFKIENYILKKADIVSTISEGMINKMKLKSTRDVFLFPNWVDTTMYFPIPEKNELKPIFNFKKTDKVILYSGAIGNKQGLEVILQAASSLRIHSDIKFVICGSGPYQRVLKDKARALALHNLFFLKLQPAEKFNQFLNMADIHLVIQKENASDLVMPSKLSTILSIGGLAIITAPQNSSLFETVSKNNMSILIEPENHELLEKTILDTLYSDNRQLRHNAFKYASKHLGKELILTNFLNHLMQPVNSEVSERFAAS